MAFLQVQTLLLPIWIDLKWPVSPHVGVYSGGEICDDREEVDRRRRGDGNKSG